MTDIRDQIDLSVFSLVCENCDAGDDMLNEVDARATGWTQIEYCTRPANGQLCWLMP